MIIEHDSFIFMNTHCINDVYKLSDLYNFNFALVFYRI